MDTYTETELKLRLYDPLLYQQLTTDPYLTGLSKGRVREASYNTAYYDTADRSLLRNGLALRVRNTGAGYVATVKDSGTESGGLYIRGEWNTDVKDEAVTVAAFAALPVGPRLQEAAGEEPLIPLLQTVFTRIAIDAETGSGAVEIAADKGEIIAGGKREPLCEVELELKTGDISGLLSVASSLAGRYPLILEQKSKFERGLLLLGDSSTMERHGEAPVNDGGSIRAVLSGGIIRAIHGVMDEQALFLDTPGDPESAHQVRVSLRRLRAILSFAKPVMRENAYLKLASAIKAMSDDFSYLRELDVLTDIWQDLCREKPDAGNMTDGLGGVLSAQRQKERDRLTVSLSSCPGTAVLLDAWRQVLGNIWRAEAEKEFARFGSQRLQKWSDRLRKGLMKETLEDIEETHRLRILGKKVRYAQDAFFPDGGDTTIEKAELKRLQTLLGDLCDICRNIEIIKKLTKKDGTQSVKEQGRFFIAGQKNEFKALSKEFYNTSF